MKITLLIILFSSSFPLFANSLKCSQNGTDVYYVNGVLTNEKKNKSDTGSIGALFDLKTEQLDSGKKVVFKGIFNPSFGVINDAAELFAEAYYIKTGKNDNAKAIYNVIKNMPAATPQDKALYDPNGYFASLSNFVTFNSANYGTLVNVAQEADDEAIKRSMASVDTLLSENNTISDAVRGNFILSKSANRKILVVAHSQGNAVVNSAFRKISDSGDDDQISYLSKYAGVFHVASPVTPLQAPYKSRNVRTNQDLLIQTAERLGLPAAGITHDVVSRSSPDVSGHLFFDTYLSPNVLVRPHGNTTTTPITMSDVFVNTLSDLATDLEDNCNTPDIDITVGGATKNVLTPGQFDYQDFTNFNNNIMINAFDKNDIDNSTTFTFIYRHYCADCSLDEQNVLKTQENVKSISDFSVPFNTSNGAFSSGYTVTVIATNKYGKSNAADFVVKAPKNKQATMSLLSQECLPHCGEGCGGASVAYNAIIQISDPDTYYGQTSEPGKYTIFYFHDGYGADPGVVTLSDGATLTLPACSRSDSQ